MVTLTRADIYGRADSAALIAAIQQAGYRAQAVEGAHPKSEPLPSTDVAMPETGQRLSTLRPPSTSYRTPTTTTATACSYCSTA